MVANVLYTLAFTGTYEYHWGIFYLDSPKSCILWDRNIAIIPIRNSIIEKQYNQVRL